MRAIQVLTWWFKMITNEDKFFRRLYDKKLCCAGLICLLSVPSSHLPAPLSGSMDKVCAPPPRILLSPQKFAPLCFAETSLAYLITKISCIEHWYCDRVPCCLCRQIVTTDLALILCADCS